MSSDGIDSNKKNKKNNILQKRYRSFFVQNFFRNNTVYKPFKYLSYEINIYTFKYLYESLTYLYKNYYNCSYYIVLCRAKKKKI